MTRQAAAVLGLGCGLLLACGRSDGGAARVASAAPSASVLARAPVPTPSGSGLVRPAVPGSVAFRLEGTVIDFVVGKSICVLLEGGQVLCGDVQQEFERIVKTDTEKFSKIIKEMGIK